MPNRERHGQPSRKKGRNEVCYRRLRIFRPIPTDDVRHGQPPENRVPRVPVVWLSITLVRRKKKKKKKDPRPPPSQILDELLLPKSRPWGAIAVAAAAAISVCRRLHV